MGSRRGFLFACLFPFKAGDKKGSLRMDGNDTGLWRQGREGIISGKRCFGEERSENRI